MTNDRLRSVVSASLLGLALLCVACEEREESPSAPNVLLFVVDTLRADSLGCYGNQTVKTPAVDAFAREGMLYRAAYAPSSWTRASLASMLTGLYPEAHGVEERESLLPEQLVSLPEYFSEHGYATAAVITNPNVGSFFGFAQGFDSFDELYQRQDVGKVASSELITPSDVAAARALEWIDATSKPFFLLVHTIDPHWPYDPPAAYDRYGGDYQGILDHYGGRTNAINLTAPERERVRSFYYGEVAFNDESFGQVIEHLRSTGILDDTVVAFTSDHGEEFWEHGGRWHGHQLYQENIRVPLVVRYPPAFRHGQEITQPVQLVDLFPTLLELANIPIPTGIDGKSFLSKDHSGTAYATLDLDGFKKKALVTDTWKLVFDAGSGQRALYDLREAPFETIDRSREHPELVEKLFRSLSELSEANLATHRRLFPDGLDATALEVDLPPDSRRALEALGYIEAADEKSDSNPPRRD